MAADRTHLCQTRAFFYTKAFVHNSVAICLSIMNIVLFQVTQSTAEGFKNGCERSVELPRDKKCPSIKSFLLVLVISDVIAVSHLLDMNATTTISTSTAYAQQSTCRLP